MGDTFISRSEQIKVQAAKELSFKSMLRYVEWFKGSNRNKQSSHHASHPASGCGQQSGHHASGGGQGCAETSGKWGQGGAPGLSTPRICGTAWRVKMSSKCRELLRVLSRKDMIHLLPLCEKGIMEKGKTESRQTCFRTIGVRQVGADWETLQKREQVEGGPTS